MKINALSLIVGLSFAFTQAFSQNYQGAAAEKLIEGSSLVRIGQKSSVPEFVQLQNGHEFPASKFPAWAKKAFDLDEKIGFVKLREENDNIGMQHVRYQVMSNGTLVFGAFVYTHGRNDMVSSINGKLPSSIGIGQPTLSEENALESAKNHV